MNYGYLYVGIGSAIVIIGTFLIFQLESNTVPQIIPNGLLSGTINICCSKGQDINAGYQVDVYSSNGDTLVGRATSNVNHYYSLQLPEGNYLIYTYPPGEQIPNLVSVISGRNTIFDISYDNGVR